LSGLSAHKPPSFAIHLPSKTMLSDVMGIAALDLSSICEIRLAAARAIGADGLATPTAVAGRGVVRGDGAGGLVSVVTDEGDPAAEDWVGTVTTAWATGRELGGAVTGVVSVVDGTGAMTADGPAIRSAALEVCALLRGNVDPVAPDTTNHEPTMTMATATIIAAGRWRPFACSPPMAPTLRSGS